MQRVFFSPEEKSGQAGRSRQGQGSGLFSFTWKALLWGVLTWYLARQVGGSHFWVVALGLLVYGLPIALSGYYATTIRQVRRLAFFSGRGWLYRLLSRRILQGMLWICWAILSALFLLAQFHTYSGVEWVGFFLVIPLFWMIFVLSRRLIARELKPFLVVYTALIWARWLTPVVMVVLSIAFLPFIIDYPQHVSLEQAVAAEKARAVEITGSALLYQVFQVQAYFAGAKIYFLGRLGGQETLLAAAIFALGGVVVFYNACAILSCFLIPAVEYRRVFGPLSEEPVPPPLLPQSRRLAAIAALFTFFALFIYLPAITSVELFLKHHPQLSDSRVRTEAWVAARLEEIDNQLYQAGTIDQLHQARLVALARVEASLVDVEGQVEHAFALMQANVDGYLDWYYGLPAEYLRIAHVLGGHIEGYMAEKLEEHLGRGGPFDDFDAALEKAIGEHQAALDQYQRAAGKIMAENQVEVMADGDFQVTRRISLGEVFSPPVSSDLIDFKTRVSGGAAAGVATAVVAKKIVAKVVGKNVFKLAAQSLGKILAGKAAGAAGGSTLGAAVGLVVGGPVGAAAGGVIGGLVVGVSVDKLLLLLEEAVSRDEFKQTIVAALDEGRSDFIAGLRGRQE